MSNLIPGTGDSANSTCRPMAQSTLCMDFAPAYVNFSNSWTMTTFDTVIKLWVDSPRHTSDFNLAYGCAWDGHNLRYSYSFGCAQQIFSASDNACMNSTIYNYATWPRLCKSTCRGYYNSLAAIFSNPLVCPGSNVDQSMLNARQKTLDSISQFCNQYGSERKSCMLQSSVEASFCGFATLQSLVNYCSNSNDRCCKQLNISVDKNTGPILGMAIALAAVVVLCGALVFYLLRRYNRRNPGYGPDKSVPPPNQMLFNGYPFSPSGVMPPSSMSNSANYSNSTGNEAIPNGHIPQQQVYCSRESILNPFYGASPVVQNLHREANNLMSPILAKSKKILHGNMASKAEDNGDGVYHRAYLESTDQGIRLRPLSRPISRNECTAMSTDESGGLSPEPGSALAQPHRVVFSYHPSAEPSRPSDEISLRKGDIVQIKEMWNDGWCVGVNQSSNEIGAWPLGCIESAAVNSKSASSSKLLGLQSTNSSILENSNSEFLTSSVNHMSRCNSVVTERANSLYHYKQRRNSRFKSSKSPASNTPKRFSSWLKHMALATNQKNEAATRSSSANGSSADSRYAGDNYERFLNNNSSRQTSAWEQSPAEGSKQFYQSHTPLIDGVHNSESYTKAQANVTGKIHEVPVVEQGVRSSLDNPFSSTRSRCSSRDTIEAAEVYSGDNIFRRRCNSETSVPNTVCSSMYRAAGSQVSAENSIDDPTNLSRNPLTLTVGELPELGSWDGPHAKESGDYAKDPSLFLKKSDSQQTLSEPQV